VFLHRQKKASSTRASCSDPPPRPKEAENSGTGWEPNREGKRKEPGKGWGTLKFNFGSQSQAYRGKRIPPRQSQGTLNLGVDGGLSHTATPRRHHGRSKLTVKNRQQNRRRRLKMAKQKNRTQRDELIWIPSGYGQKAKEKNHRPWQKASPCGFSLRAGASPSGPRKNRDSPFSAGGHQ